MNDTVLSAVEARSAPLVKTYPVDLERFVDDLYRILLNRPADPGALAAKVAALESGIWSPGELMREIVGSAEFAGLAPEFLHRFAAEQRRPLFNDCTQYGELHLLLKAWINDTAAARFVVDVGARGRERSNSYDLLRHFGWRGLLVEANPALIDDIRRDFAGLDIELVSCAVSDFNGRAQLTLGANDDVSSLESAAAATWGATKGLVDVLVRRLPDLLEECGAPPVFDLLSLDIEGEDIKVFNDLCDDGRFRPTWVLLEASYDFSTKSLEDLPTSESVRTGYVMVGQTKANILLRRRS